MMQSCFVNAVVLGNGNALPLALEKAWKEKEADNAAATDKSVAADTAQDAAQKA